MFLCLCYTDFIKIIMMCHALCNVQEILRWNREGDLLRVEQLQYLVEIAKVASINKASERLHITQQSLNASLTKLEQEMGVSLFYRSSTGVILTKEGETVLEYAQEIIQKAEEMKRAVQPEEQAAASNRMRDTLELSAGPAFSTALLPAALTKLHQAYTQVRISLVERENLDMIQGLLNNESRLYLMTVFNEYDREFAMLDLQKVFYRVIGTGKVCAVISMQHPLARQKSITIRTLLRYPLAIYQASEKAPNPLLEYMQLYGKMQIAVQTNNLYVYRQYIDAGSVIGFMPQFANKQMMKPREGTVLVPIKDLPETKVICMSDLSYYQKKRRLIDIFLQYLKNAMGEDCNE